MISRSVKGNIAKSVFFEDTNDIDVYIEDSAIGYEKLYAIILGRLFLDKYKISKVFPIGNRLEVIASQKKYKPSDRKSIFIIDGDIYLLSDQTLKPKGLYSLPFYCIENILCDIDALIEIMYEEDCIASIHDLREKFDYDNWSTHNEDYLFNLFIEYAVAFILSPEVQTVGFPITKLVSSSDGNIDKIKFDERINNIVTSLIERFGENQYIEIKNKLLHVFTQLNIKKTDIVSGKDYLFPLLKTRLRHFVRAKMSDINLKIRIAKICDLTRLKSLHDTELI